MGKIKKYIAENIIYLALIQAIIATLGSLFFSEIKHYTPCVLCWYQRILMYPLVLIILVGILRKDKGVYLYVLPLSILGWLISGYHVLLQNGIVPETSVTCSLAASCATKHVGYFGFITIPVMSFTAFTVITVSMLIFRKLNLPGKKRS